MTDKVPFYASSLSNPLYTATGFKNKIINGAMQVNQRPITSLTSITSNQSTPITADRWGIGIGISGTIGVFAVNQRTDHVINGVNNYATRLTASTGATGGTQANFFSGIFQSIEASTFFSLIGNTATLSFWFKAGAIGTYPVTITVNGTTKTYATTFNIGAINTPTYIQLPIYFDPAFCSSSPPIGTAVAAVINIGYSSGSTFQTGTLGWSTGTFTSTTTSTQWALTSGNYIEFTQVQLELNSTATSFEFRDLGVETYFCLRDYELLVLNGLVVSCSGSTTSAFYGTVDTLVPMRSVPTLTYISSTNFFNTSTNSPVAATISTIALNGSVTSTSFIPVVITLGSTIASATVVGSFQSITLSLSTGN